MYSNTPVIVFPGTIFDTDVFIQHGGFAHGLRSDLLHFTGYLERSIYYTIYIWPIRALHRCIDKVL